MNQLRQLLQSLPEEIRDIAIRNNKSYQRFPITQAATVWDALTLAFDWSLSPEGYDYWYMEWRKIAPKEVKKKELQPELF